MTEYRDPPTVSDRAVRAEFALGVLMASDPERVEPVVRDADPSGRLLERVRLQAHWAKPRAGT